MLTLLAKYLSVYLSSMVKFIAGPLTGLATGLNFVETALLTALGMMTTVLLLTLMGKPMRTWLQKYLSKKRKRFSPRNRQFVRIWKSWGVFGVSFLTPVVFSPIGGALLANIFGGAKKDIITYMLISAIFWGFTYSVILFYLKDIVL